MPYFDPITYKLFDVCRNYKDGKITSSIALVREYAEKFVASCRELQLKPESCLYVLDQALTRNNFYELAIIADGLTPYKETVRRCLPFAQENAKTREDKLRLIYISAISVSSNLWSRRAPKMELLDSLISSYIDDYGIEDIAPLYDFLKAIKGSDIRKRQNEIDAIADEIIIFLKGMPDNYSMSTDRAFKRLHGRQCYDIAEVHEAVLRKSSIAGFTIKYVDENSTSSVNGYEQLYEVVNSCSFNHSK